MPKDRNAGVVYNSTRDVASEPQGILYEKYHLVKQYRETITNVSEDPEPGTWQADNNTEPSPEEHLDK